MKRLKISDLIKKIEYMLDYFKNKDPVKEGYINEVVTTIFNSINTYLNLNYKLIHEYDGEMLPRVMIDYNYRDRVYIDLYLDKDNNIDNKLNMKFYLILEQLRQLICLYDNITNYKNEYNINPNFLYRYIIHMVDIYESFIEE